MSAKPMLLVQEISPGVESSIGELDLDIVAIAVYGKGLGVPLSVSTQRIFDGDSRFRFPSEITNGATKTRIVYRYTIPQWLEVLETTARPGAPVGLKQLMIPLLLYLQKQFPDVFMQVPYDTNFDQHEYAELVPMQ